MNEEPRRRRVRELEPQKTHKAFPLFPLFIVVVLLGLGAGALIHGIIAGRQNASSTPTTTVAGAAPGATDAPAATPPPAPAVRKSLAPASPSGLASGSTPPTVTPAPRVTPHRIALGSPHPKPAVNPSSTAPPQAVPSPTPKAPPPTVAPRQIPTPKPAIPKPSTPKPATPKPVTLKPATPAPASASGAAAQLARGYLEALMQGNHAAANTALGRGPDNTDLPEAALVNARTRFTDTHATPNGDGTYKVEIEMVTPGNGTFFCTFQASHNDVAQYLSEHYCIRVQ